MTLNQFVLFKTNKAGHQACRRSNGRDDTTRNQLRLVPVSRRNGIILSPQIRSRDNKVHMEVGIVILLKIGREDLYLIETSLR